MQLGLTGAGLATLVAQFGAWFAAVRWLGVACLIILGVRQWRAAANDLPKRPGESRSRRRTITQALAVSLTNPKTLLFFGAFLPQFMTAGEPAGQQLAILSLTYLVVAATIDSAWALLATRAGTLLIANARLRHRFSSGLLIGAGAGLALVRA